MPLIERYLEAMLNKDYTALSEAFDKDGTIMDRCPNGTTQHKYHVYGKEAIAMFYRNKFTFARHSISECEVINDLQANFVSNYDGYLVMAIATIHSVSPLGLIESITIRPR